MTVVVFHVVTLRPGQPWPDDFALYLLHARNFVEGHHYTDTGYVYNPLFPAYSPPMYPPGFSLLLAPFYALAGLNFDVLRLPVIASFVGSLVVLGRLFAPALSHRLVLITIALIGFQPYFSRFKNLLLPDYTFLLLLLLSLYLLQRLEQDADAGRFRLPLALLAGACVFATIATRVLGVALFAALPLYHIVRWKRPQRATLVAVVVALLLLLAQWSLLPPSRGYVTQVTDIWQTSPSGVPTTVPLLHFREALAATDVLWQAHGEVRAPPFRSAGQRAVVLMLMATTAGLALLGYAIRLRRVTITELLVAVYLGGLLWGGLTNARYLLPILVLMICYAVVGAAFVSSLGRFPRLAITAVAAAAIAAYAVNHARAQRGPFESGVTAPAAQQLFDFVAKCTAPESRLATRRPRALALFTQREAIAPSPRQLSDGDSFLRFMRSAAAEHVVAWRGSTLESLLLAQPATFPRRFHNDVFAVHAYAASADRAAVPLATCP